jgi:hypothetical protein
MAEPRGRFDDQDGPSGSRRSADVVMEQTRGEVALLRQAVELGTKATDARFDGISKGLDNLALKMDAVRDSQAEPGASPAGRQLLEKWQEHERLLVEHEAELSTARQFRAEILGGIKTLRTQVAIVGTILGVVAGIDAVVSIARQVHP